MNGEHDKTNPGDFTPEQKDRLEQELLELHFGCHPDPAALQERLAHEPALRALQEQIAQQARVLQQAARPAQPELVLPASRGTARAGTGGRWFRRPLPRLLAAASLAAAAVLTFLVLWGIDARRLSNAEGDQLHLTVSAPRAVPAGAPWSFTVQSQDLGGEAATCTVWWKALLPDGTEIATQEAECRGNATFAMPADLRMPARLLVGARRGDARVEHTLTLSTAAAAPLVHVTTDKPVYRPGEPVFVRAVALERITMAPRPQQVPLGVRVLDAKGAVVAQQSHGINVEQAVGQGSVGGYVWLVPEASAGGEHTVEVAAVDGSFPPECVTFVVRSYQPPRLDTTLVLDRKTYAPGQQGAAELTVERLSGGVAAGAGVRAALVLDGLEVWTQDGALDQHGRAVFRFQVPAEVTGGAARFVARITDGGVVETEVKPFVVPTGKVLVACFPEGGELVAGVDNRLYLEVTDPLGRPVDTSGSLIDGEDAVVAVFATEHQGRGRVTFTPRQGALYRVRTADSEQLTELPPVQEGGIALRALHERTPAGEALRVSLQGSGDGPWLVGAFCRGVLLGQATVRPGSDGRVRETVALELPAQASGVLRVTVFDRQLRPVAERLVQRAAGRRIAVDLLPERGAVAPGDGQKVTVRTRNELGNPIAAVVGLTVTDRGAIAIGTEPRVGLLEQAMLFADVERTEDLGDFFAAGEHGARNADLLLGTRGWRRFVWRNDEAAQRAIAAGGDWASGVLAREGYSHTPQAVSNLQTAQAAVAGLERAVYERQNAARIATAWALILLVLLGIGEGIALGLRRLFAVRPLPQFVGGLVGAFGLVFLVALSQTRILGLSEMAGIAGDDRAMLLDFDVEEAKGAAVDLPRALRVAVDPAGLALMDAVDGWNMFGAVGGELRGGARPADGGPAGPVPGGPAGARVADQPLDKIAELRADLRRLQLEGRLDNRRVMLPQQPLRIYAHQHVGSATRSDFTETIYWNPLLVTDASGTATVSFDTSSAVTTWTVRADAHAVAGTAGRIGQGEASFDSRLPFHMEARLPVEVTAGDLLRIPVAFTLEDGDGQHVELLVRTDGPIALQGTGEARVALREGRGRYLVPLRVDATTGTATVQLAGTASRFQDRVAQTFPVAPRGFPHGRSWAGTVGQGEPSHFTLPVPASAAPGSGRVTLKLFPSPLSALREGLDGILREPCGCFEQASSSNYPNVMVLAYLEASGDDLPAIAARARDLLPKGYQKIAGYECKERGYEWFGGDPGHEALTAYGLLQFRDMQGVFHVDAGMVARTRQWLLSRRDGKGGFQRNDRALDTFGRAPQTVTDPYLVYALLYSGTPAVELTAELDVLAARAGATGDAYELSVIACALQAGGRPEASAARARLRPMQNEDGSLRGNTASITSSRGEDLAVETTAWAVLAWLADDTFQGPVRSAVEFVQSKKSARGTFGATQATIMALRALTAYAEAARTMKAPGTVRVFVDGRMVASESFAAGHPDAVTFDLWSKLTTGDREIRLELEGGGAALPWACDLAYHADRPADDPDGAVGIRTSLASATVEEGRTVALQVEIQNRTAEGLPMAMAIVGIPAGLELPTAVLEDRLKAADFDLWELRGRELVLYWRGLAPGAEKKVAFDCIARIPGTTTGPASRGYLYYTADQKRWAAPLLVEVTEVR